VLLETPGSFAARALVRSYPFRERASTREPLDVSILVLRITKSPVWTFTRGRTTGGACPPVPVRVGGAARRYAPRPRLVPGRGRCSPRTGTTPRQRINEVEDVYHTTVLGVRVRYFVLSEQRYKGSEKP
jgi:hypothetical protein